MELRQGKPDVGGTAVRAGHGALAGGEFFEQVLHFLGSEGIVGFDGGTAGGARHGFMGRVFFVVVRFRFQGFNENV